jgi:uncharacterized hydrophobic protein (TIGR00271 family)
MRITDTLNERLNKAMPTDVRSLQEMTETIIFSPEKFTFSYWIYLALSGLIATIGLAMDSAAVVFGAMLISPFMAPLVQTGMAFAVGSIKLACKSMIRVFLSILFFVLLTAFLTLLFPIHEVTNQIAIRAQPTALDLFVAFFVAIAASWTTLRRYGSTLMVAAGTAVSVSLVPPLCVMGFGLGIPDEQMFTGAALLFTANFATIILVSDFLYAIMGFSRIDKTSLEEKVLRKDNKLSRLYLLLDSIDAADNKDFWWVKFRVILPSVFVAIIAMPLLTALSQVAWEINTKKNMSDVLDDFGKRHPILDKQQILMGRHISLHLAVTGDPTKEEAIVKELKAPLQKAIGSEPSLHVDIIPSPGYRKIQLKEVSEVGEKRVTLGPVKEGLPSPGPNPEKRDEKIAAIKPAGDVPDTLNGERSRNAAAADQAGYTATTLGLTFKGKEPQHPDPDLFQPPDIKESINKVIENMNERENKPEYFDWEFVVTPKGSELQVSRISNENLNEDTKDTISGLVKDEAGIEVTVSEKRWPKTVFSAKKPFSLHHLENKADKILAGILDKKAIGVMVGLKLSGGPKTIREKTATDATLLNYVKKKIPADRLKVEYNSTSWDIRLFVRKDYQNAFKKL